MSEPRVKLTLVGVASRLWRSEAFWFGFWETLSLRIVFDPEGHRRDFLAMLRRSKP